MRRIVLLLFLGCLASLALGQYVETTVFLPDSVSGLTNVGSLLYHSRNNTIYVGGDEDFLISVDARTGERLARIAVGSGPHLLCSNPTDNKVYCANGDGTMTVIDGQNNQPLKSLLLGQRLSDLAYIEEENKLCCCDKHYTFIRVVDCTADTLEANVQVGGGPYACCYNPQLNRAYCVRRIEDEVSVIDCGADTLMASIWVQGVEPLDICHDSATNAVYVVDSLSSAVSIIDCVGDSLTRLVRVGLWPRAIIAGPPGKVYCANYGDSSVSVISSNGVKTVRTCTYPQTLAYDPVNAKVYCAGNGPSLVTVIDCDNDSAIAQVASGYRPAALCWNPVGNNTYVACSGDEVVTVIGGTSDSAEAIVQFGASHPGPLCYNTVSNRLYCLDRSSDVLYVLDGENQLLTSMEIEGDPYSLLWSPATDKLYLCNADSGAVTVVDCKSDSIVATMITGSDAYDLECTDDGKVYVAADSGVVVIDGSGDTVIAVIHFARPGYIPSALCYARTDGKMYVGTPYAADSAVVRVIDTRGDTVIRALALWEGFFTYQVGLSWVQGYDKLYVTNPNSDSVAVVDCAGDTILKRIRVSTNIALVYSDSATGKVYCYDDWSHDLRVIKAATDTFYRTMDVRGASAMMDNGKQGPANRLYCTDRANGIVTVIAGYKTDSVLRRISVGEYPCALAWNPTYSRIYVANEGGSSITVIRDTLGPGVEEVVSDERGVMNAGPTVIHGILNLQPAIFNLQSEIILLSADGRKVMDLKPGANDVRALAPGVYFVRTAQAQAQAQAVRKVVLAE